MTQVKSGIIGFVVLLVAVAVLSQGFPINKPYGGKQDKKIADVVVFSATWNPAQTTFKMTIGWTVSGSKEQTIQMRNSPFNMRVEVPKGAPVSMRVVQWATDKMDMHCIIQRNGKVVTHNERHDEKGSCMCFDPPPAGPIIVTK